MNPILYFIDDDYPTNVYNELILSNIKEIGSFKIYEDAELALENLKTTILKPDFLFLDINMPRLNGWEVAEEIHQSPSDYLAAPYHIFMLTTSLGKHDFKKQEVYPFIRKIVAKPITEEMILEILRNYYQRDNV